MAIIERDVVLQGKTASGDQTIDLPITALKNVEDTAEIKTAPTAEDYIPIIDSADNGQMKKTPYTFAAVMGEKSKNLLKNTAESLEKGGVRFTVHADGSITADGTASEDITFYIATESSGGLLLEDGSYLYSGCSGGSADTYLLRYYNSSNAVNADLYDGEITITHVNGNTHNCALIIRSGTVLSDQTFYPMLRAPEIADSTYEAYRNDLPGKVEVLSSLMDKCLITRGRITGTDDLNTAMENGIYRYTGRPLNAPNPSVSDYGLLLVMKHTVYTIQLAFSYFGSETGKGVYFRSSTNTGQTWSAWRKFAFVE